MAMMIDCPPVPISDDERLAIVTLANDSRSIAQSSIEFESVSVTKCITKYGIKGSPPANGRAENIGFYGLFPHKIETDKYRERYSIRCSRSVDYRESAVVRHRADCIEELERYMQYDGLPHEVRLKGAVSVEDATAYLDYLFAYDFPRGAQVRIMKMLLMIQSVDKSLVRGQLDFHASFNHSGCATTTFGAKATREQSLVFGKVYDQSSIC